MKPINTYVIPTLNNIEGLKKLVASLYKYTPPNFRVIVVFNGTENDYLNAKAYFDANAEETPVHLWVRPHKNLGFGASMNLGIKLATTEFVTLANDDVEVIYDTWWQEVEELFAKHSNMGGFNPHSFINKRHTGERVPQFEMKDDYSAEEIAAMKAVFHKEHMYGGLICTFFTICRKAMFDKIGLFDESFGLGSGEDYDLCVRAAKAGFSMSGGSAVMVKHWWGGTKDNMPQGESNYNLIAAGNQRMIEKWGPHCQEIDRRVADGRMTIEEKAELKGGWPGGGADVPLDKDKVLYASDGWYQVMDL